MQLSVPPAKEIFPARISVYKQIGPMSLRVKILKGRVISFLQQSYCY